VYVGQDGEAVRIAGTAQEITERKHVEGRVRRSEELMREAQELARIGSFEWDAATNAVTWSDGLRQLYGVAEGAAATYEDYLRYVHPAHRDQVRAAVQQTYSTGTPFEHEYRILTADGAERWVHARGELMTEPRTGKRLGLRGYCQDITEQKRADTTIAMLAAIVESSDDAIVAETLEGSITTWNRGAERLYGYTAGEAIGKPFAMLVPGGRDAEFEALLGRLRRGESIEPLRAPLLRKDGTPIEVLIRVSAIRDAAGQIVGVSTFARGVAVPLRTEKTVSSQRSQRPEDTAEPRTA
jgi:PAS domain S-box-containing protein